MHPETSRDKRCAIEEPNAGVDPAQAPAGAPPRPASLAQRRAPGDEDGPAVRPRSVGVWLLTTWALLVHVAFFAALLSHADVVLGALARLIRGA